VRVLRFFIHGAVLYFIALPEPLVSYERKEDLVILSGALGLRMIGTKAELRARIESFVSAHSDSDIQQNPRFSGLFHDPTEDARLDGGGDDCVHKYANL
jgi:hypothetical protein